MSYLDFFSKDCLRYIPSSRLSQKKVLVVGCGNGGDCAPFVEAQEVHGIDICDDIGQNFIHDKVQYFQESAESMNRESNYYDLVFSVATLEHIHNLEAAFAEILRVTKLGGLIYCVAAPLWNSYEGHHTYGVFPEFPWIHLRLSPEELIHYIEAREDIGSYTYIGNSTSIEKSKIQDLVSFIFSDYFNRISAETYLRIADSLDISYCIRNDIWHEGQALLTSDILKELQAKGFSQEELLSVSHTFVAIK